MSFPITFLFVLKKGKKYAVLTVCNMGNIFRKRHCAMLLYRWMECVILCGSRGSHGNFRESKARGSFSWVKLVNQVCWSFQAPWNQLENGLIALWFQKIYLAFLQSIVRDKLQVIEKNSIIPNRRTTFRLVSKFWPFNAWW